MEKAYAYMCTYIFLYTHTHTYTHMGFPGGSVVKNPPAMQETQVQSLGQEDPPGGRNGNTLQCSRLENPVDRGSWYAIVHWVSKSQYLQLASEISTKGAELPS